MGELFRIQDEVLRDALSFERLDTVERDILSILSWVPLIDARLVRDVIVARHNITVSAFAEKIGGLVSVCLVFSSASHYLISAPIRGVFRRLHGFGDPKLRVAFADALRREWSHRRGQEFSAELLDALVYMTALEGASLPAEFSKLLLPSILQEVVKDTYDTGHEDEDALRRVISWGMPAQDMKMDETTREEILSYVLRAQVRLQDVRGARDLLGLFESRGYRSRFYLRAFLIRLTGGDLKDAIGLLRKAKDVRKYRRRVLADLAGCYQRLGMWKELASLINEEGDATDNAALLDFKVGMLIAQSDFDRASEAIRRLRSNGWDDGRSERRYATLIMKRDKNYSQAKVLLTALVDKNSRGHLTARMSRAIAAAEDGDYRLAQGDADYFRSRRDGNDAALRVEARIYNRRGEYDVAESKLGQIKGTAPSDYLLQARIFESRAADVRTGPADRATFADRARELRTKYPTVDEFTLD